MPYASDIETQGRDIADRFRDAGGFMSRQPKSAELVKIRGEAEKWIMEVEESITDQNAEGICRYLSWYDIVHRIAFGTPGDGIFMDHWQNRVLTDIAAASSKRSRPQESVIACREWLRNAVRNRLSRSPRTVSPRLRDWYLAHSAV